MNTPSSFLSSSRDNKKFTYFKLFSRKICVVFGLDEKLLQQTVQKKLINVLRKPFHQKSTYILHFREIIFCKSKNYFPLKVAEFFYIHDVHLNFN